MATRGSAGQAGSEVLGRLAERDRAIITTATTLTTNAATVTADMALLCAGRLVTAYAARKIVLGLIGTPANADAASGMSTNWKFQIARSGCWT